MRCTQCSPPAPIRDRGLVTIYADNSSATEKLLTWATALGLSPQTLRSGLTLRYESKEQLLEALRGLLSHMPVQEQIPLQIQISDRFAVPRLSAAPVPLHAFLARLQHYPLVQLIADAAFTSHMQPIIDVGTQQVFAYEFLLRPTAEGPFFHPGELFRVARETGLHSFLDRAARVSAIEVSAALLPAGVKRFINFLPSSIYNPNFCLTHTFDAIDQHALHPGDFVFEVVETEQIEDIGHLKMIFDVYRTNGVQVALDDVGSGFSTVEVLSELKPDYVKIDRSLIDRCDEQPAKQRLIRDIVERTRDFGGAVLAEGMEREEEWHYCRDAGIDLAQGYLLGKPAASPVSPIYLPFGA